MGRILEENFSLMYSKITTEWKRQIFILINGILWYNRVSMKKVRRIET